MVSSLACRSSPTSSASMLNEHALDTEQPEEDHTMSTSAIAEARDYAISMHGSQMYGVHPYSHHLDAVAQALAPYGLEAQVVGYLHDVVEDTPATIGEVRFRFGDAVAACVALLTDEPGESRNERKAKTYAKLAEVTGPEELALVVKVADRLANVRACVADAKHDLLGVYRGEHEAFRAAAFRAGRCDDL